ncbi:MAG: GntR family transcriptional regulator [Alphaproteobacteria bacterium]|nr:GntR family transcriptional regulator [Alphaproteobacteria bacterium]MBU0798017.1 GntR family transcriptional regulator [Alphaproteobacteria bacterium]MBU0888316.1 GntR family transcriptional regulator [Alphaproteobacteria bacterium]MBU1814208.1 GntR family transcriptional regulator [Alphaproteobacteria bacterium]MBU2089257.1 GntR family transcriptional regulator [Alphaproteobacteria bacterium]
MKQDQTLEPPRSDLQAEIVGRLIAMLEHDRPALGSRLPEQSVAKQLGVSRSPVRLAMKFLEAQGYLASEHGRGFIVARLPEGGGPPADIPESRVATLHDRLLRDRATGILGSEVAEAELAERYAASRATLARVLARLTGEGLIERQRGHGWRFIEVLGSDEAYEDSYEFRIAIECAALRARRFNADPAKLAVIRQRHEAILAAPAEVLSGQWFDTNAAFHEGIAELSGNRFYLQAIRHQNTLRRMLEYAEFSAMPRDRVEQSCREHLAILDAIESGDRAWAEALMRRHLSQALDYTNLEE